MHIKRLLEYLETYLALSNFSTDPSQNGLQVEGNPDITAITTAVDACMTAFEQSTQRSSQLLLVHHGLLWGHPLTITGILRQRLAFLLHNGISLYAVHLPLDAHPEVGNNAQLAKLLGMEVGRPFGNYRGYSLGVEATFSKGMDRESFVKKVEQTLHTKVSLLPFGRDKIKRVAIVSGGGASELSKAANQGFDLLLTGEAEHSSFHPAREYQINVAYAGHYATETVGIKALGEHLAQQFGLQHTFLDIPTGL